MLGKGRLGLVVLEANAVEGRDLLARIARRLPALAQGQELIVEGLGLGLALRDEAPVVILGGLVLQDGTAHVEDRTEVAGLKLGGSLAIAGKLRLDRRQAIPEGLALLGQGIELGSDLAQRLDAGQRRGVGRKGAALLGGGLVQELAAALALLALQLRFLVGRKRRLLLLQGERELLHPRRGLLKGIECCELGLELVEPLGPGTVLGARPRKALLARLDRVQARLELRAGRLVLGLGLDLGPQGLAGLGVLREGRELGIEGLDGEGGLVQAALQGGALGAQGIAGRQIRLEGGEVLLRRLVSLVIRRAGLALGLGALGLLEAKLGRVALLEGVLAPGAEGLQVASVLGDRLLRGVHLGKAPAPERKLLLGAREALFGRATLGLLLGLLRLQVRHAQEAPLVARKLLVGLVNPRLEVLLRLLEGVRGLAVLLDPQDPVEDGLAARGRVHEDRGEGPLRHADGRAEELVQVGVGQHPQVLAQPGEHVRLLLGHAGLGGGVEDVVGGLGVADNRVLALVHPGLEGHPHGARRGPSAQEVLLLVRKTVEQGEADGLQDGGLARAVGARDGVGAQHELEAVVRVPLDVLQFDRDDVHAYESSDRVWVRYAAISAGGAPAIACCFKESTTWP
ncbi:hypothetical protein D3C86_1199110 [compost metagenome]